VAEPGPAAQPAELERVKVGPLEIDRAEHRVFVNGEEIRVSPLEMRLLLFLVRTPGKMRSRKELLTEVWGYHPEVSSRTLDTHVKRIPRQVWRFGRSHSDGARGRLSPGRARGARHTEDRKPPRPRAKAEVSSALFRHGRPAHLRRATLPAASRRRTRCWVLASR